MHKHTELWLWSSFYGTQYSTYTNVLQLKKNLWAANNCPAQLLCRLELVYCLMIHVRPTSLRSTSVELSGVNERTSEYTSALRVRLCVIYKLAGTSNNYANRLCIYTLHTTNSITSHVVVALSIHFRYGTTLQIKR